MAAGRNTAPARRRRPTGSRSPLVSHWSIPSERRRKAAEDYLRRTANTLAIEERTKLADEVMRVLADTRFSELFAPGSRAEVPIVGRIILGSGELVSISAQVDRLSVTPKAVLIGDFKSDRLPPRRIKEVSPPYVRQLALYRAVLAKLYPDRPVRAALIWTETPDLMEVSEEALEFALAHHVTARAP